MKTTNNMRSGQGTVAFTLIELLLVISIIGIVAGLSVAAMSGAGEARDRKAVEAQKAKLILAIEDYKAKYGSYPPDRPGTTVNNAHWNPLAYELGGMRRSGVNFQAEADPSHVVTPAMVSGYFGLTGLLNATPSATVRAKAFLSLKGGLRAHHERHARLARGDATQSAGGPSNACRKCLALPLLSRQRP
jgi:prepilin-type N-terminal cleavage/methylation domain-containing protein